jgi:cellobiose-specific phosphotransferase system component IIA
MIVYAYNLAAVLAILVASPVMVHAEDHGKKTAEHLEEAIKSGKEGSTKGVLNHIEEAKKELIEQNKEYPYTHLQKPIYGEHEKAEHDREVFEEMDIAIDEAKAGHPEQAVEALERASDHLREKEHAK